MIEVQLELSRYTGVNESFVTVSDLHQYMSDSYDVSERTVRRCLDELEDMEIVHSRQVGNTTLYVVFEDDLLPEAEKYFGAGV
jgi:DNA-binding transcriptional ArsR family regulator